MASRTLGRLISVHKEALREAWIPEALPEAHALAIARKRSLRDLAADMRAKPTPQEAEMWAWLQTKPLGFRWEFQKPLHRYICDFCCLKARTVIEIDGARHCVDYDGRRDSRLWERGYQTLRFTNDQVEQDFAAVQGEVLRALEYERRAA